jgi:hypothetical protein
MDCPLWARSAQRPSRAAFNKKIKRSSRKGQRLLQDFPRNGGYGLDSVVTGSGYQMSKAAIPFALLVAAFLVSSASAFAKGGGNGAGVAKPPGYIGHSGAGTGVAKPPGYTGHGGAGAGVAKPPGYTGHGGAGAGVAKPPGYTGHSGAGAGVAKPPGYTGHSGAGAGVAKPPGYTGHRGAGAGVAKPPG